MKKLLLIAASIFLTMTVATNLFALNRERGRGCRERHEESRYCGGDMPFLAKLNLTDEQTAKIKALREAHLKDVKPLRDKMFSKRGDLKLLWLEPNPDKEKILAVQREIRELRDQMEDKATAHRVDVFNLLTPEQKEKAKAAFPGHGAGFEMECPGMGGPGIGGPAPGMMGHGKGMMDN